MIQPPYFKHAQIWKKKQALTLGAARRRSFFLKILRLFFITAAFVIVIYVFAVLILRAREHSLPSPGQVVASAAMINPRFAGRDAQGIPFHMSAKRAVRSPSSESMFNLQAPVFMFDVEGKDDFSKVEAQRGVYNRSLNILDLYDQVHFQTRDGYDFSTEHARFFLHENRVEGTLRVHGSGPLGVIDGEAFEITDNWSRYVFKGDVRTTVQSSTTQK